LHPADSGGRTSQVSVSRPLGEVRNQSVRASIERRQSTWIRESIKERAMPARPGRTQLPPTKRWSSHEYDYIKAAVESDDYDQALADGYEEFSTNGNCLHVLRRKKASA